MTDLSENEFKKIHKPGLKGIIINYPYSRDIVIITFSLLISIVLTIISLFLGEAYSQLKIVLEILFDTIPIILGFLVAGFSLMFGFGDKSYFKLASKIKDGTSLYLKNVQSFSFALIIMLITLTIMAISKILLGIPSPFNAEILRVGHSVMLILLLFLTFYSISLLYHAVKNVFNITISHHAFLNTSD